jgi:hypothetical protein
MGYLHFKVMFLQGVLTKIRAPTLSGLTAICSTIILSHAQARSLWNGKRVEGQVVCHRKEGMAKIKRKERKNFERPHFQLHNITIHFNLCKEM